MNWGDGVTSNGVVSGPVAGVFSVTGVHTHSRKGSLSGQRVHQGRRRRDSHRGHHVYDHRPGAGGGSHRRRPRFSRSKARRSQLRWGVHRPNLIAPVSNFSATINWGDTTSSSGTVSQQANGTFIVTGSHTYAEDTTGEPAECDHIHGEGRRGATLANAAGAPSTVADAPLVSQGATIQAVEGTPFIGTLVATVTDSNPAATIADFTTGTGSVTINWGDGTTSTLTSVPPAVITASGSAAGVVFSITGCIRMPRKGTFQVTVTADDKGGSTTIAGGQCGGRRCAPLSDRA